MRLHRQISSHAMIQRKHISFILVGLICLYGSTFLLNRLDDSNIISFKLSDHKFFNHTHDSPEKISHMSTERSPQVPYSVGGTCSEKAYNAGNHQKIVSFTVYGNITGYYKGISDILSDVKRLYPGWYVRIYTDIPSSSDIVKLTASHKHLHICDVMNLPPPDTNLKNYPKMMWRFFPLGDQQVDVALFRDTDSQIQERERDAVMEWLETTNASLHVMRDHPAHTVAILGGMWGARINDKNRKKWRKARNGMFKRAYKKKKEKGLDQYLLALEVWPYFYFDSYAHDSYRCRTFLGSKPFPTQRVDGNYVGAPQYVSPEESITREECPIYCRPKAHKDWIYC